ncbi:hypothetical protein FOA52_014570 [Chlamydomonas sp. UWO 241]|nr:hypothetical protein FOA52_014570 [Chlamydomonas sp. UWO 241]
MRGGSLSVVVVAVVLLAHVCQGALNIDECDYCQACASDAAEPAASATARMRSLQGQGGATARQLQADSTGEPRGSLALHDAAPQQQQQQQQEQQQQQRQQQPSHGDSPVHVGRHLSPVGDPNEDPSLPLAMRASAYRIGGGDKVPKSSLPNCTECAGCNTQLSYMVGEATLFNRTFTNEKGATNGWLFRATTPKTASGTAVVKVYCMPLPKRPGAKVPTCAPQAILRNMRLLLALQKLSDECGFTDIVPRLWVEKVNAPVPGLGFHIRWHGLWMEVADGISMENLLNKGTPTRVPEDAMLDLFHSRLNKTQVVRAAIFDLLTSQCDRHAQNIFINEAGQLMLIDNEAALQSNWKNCGFNSILVPTTQKQEIARLSNEFVNKLVAPDAVASKGHADPQVLLDYRCYLGGGREAMGTEYPPQIDQCLRKIAGMSIEEAKVHYGFLEELPAQNLVSRAKDMVTKGFEWSYKYGEPRNADPKRYRVQPKCCELKVGMLNGRRQYQCAHEWEPKWELPIGDMVTGREWKKDRPDTGTYTGGTFPEDGPDGDQATSFGTTAAETSAATAAAARS